MPNKAKTNAIASGGMLLNIFAPDHLSASQAIFKANSQCYPREDFKVYYLSFHIGRFHDSPKDEPPLILCVLRRIAGENVPRLVLVTHGLILRDLFSQSLGQN